VDNLNRFETEATHAVARAEWFLALVVVVVLAVAHLDEIDWVAFVALFLIIDIIGYIPGAIAYRRSADHAVAKGYYVAYNVMHSFLTAAAIAAAWSLIFGPEWALLALPIHLCGDRALFGNTMKPFGISFEPVKHPEFDAFDRAYHRVGVRSDDSTNHRGFRRALPRA